MSGEERMTRIPFKGTMEDWFYWELRFMTRAQYYGFHTILEGTAQAPPDSIVIDETTATGKREKELRKLHARAYYELSMSMDLSNSEGKLAFRIVKNATSSRHPNGDAREAWVRLREEYESDAGSAQIELKRKFYGSVLKVSQNPVVFVTQLQNIRERLDKLGISISERELMLQVIDSLPRQYENSQEMLKVEYDRKTLTLKDLKQRLKDRYVTLNKRKGAKLVSLGDEDDDLDEGESMALNAGQVPKCSNCGRLGHTAAECWAPGGGKAGQGPNQHGKRKQFKGNCRFCGKYGHKAADCWENPKSPNYRGGKTTGQANQASTNQATGYDGYESDVSFMAQTGTHVPENRKNVWIAAISIKINDKGLKI